MIWFAIVVSSTFAAEIPKLIEPIPKSAIACGCQYSITSSTEKVLFLQDAGSSGTAYLAGKKSVLSLESSDKMNAKKSGDKYTFSYKGKGIAISFEGRRTSDCPSTKPDCEDLTNTGNLTVIKGKQKEVIPVMGHCSSCR